MASQFYRVSSKDMFVIHATRVRTSYFGQHGDVLLDPALKSGDVLMKGLDHGRDLSDM